jgi:hypothetical protein
MKSAKAKFELAPAPEESGLSRDEKRALFVRYEALVVEEAGITRRLLEIRKERRRIAEEIDAHLGRGPFIFNGLRLYVASCGRAGLYVRGFLADTEPQEI